MTTQYMPKTLAKTLSYILYHSPWEYGLFWNANGTMPWKELYWALQEDHSLRFVRESHLREIKYLGIELPALLDGTVLRLQDGFPVPEYPVAVPLSERLFYACRRKHYPVVLQYGLSAMSRPLLALSTDKEMALRLGKRRDPEPVLIEVLAKKASERGVVFREAGPGLYLVETVAVEYLMGPPLREEELSKAASKKKKGGKITKAETPMMPGSFFMAPQQMHPSSPDLQSAGAGGGAKKKGKREAAWKREARKERHKREI